MIRGRDWETEIHHNAVRDPVSWPSVADDRECVLDLNYAMLGDTGAVACAPYWMRAAQETGVCWWWWED